MAHAFPKLGIKNVEDGLAAVGRGELSSGEVLRALGVEPDAAAKRKPRHMAPEVGSNAISVRGIGGMLPIRISPVTGAVPGERIVGIMTPGEGVTVYPIFSKALSAFEDEPDRWIDLAWDTSDESKRYPARIKAVIHNEVGALAQLAQAIGENGGNIENLQMTNRAQDFFDIDLTVEVHDLRHLNGILQTLRSRPLVSSVHRVTG